MANTYSATVVRASSQNFSAADSASLSITSNITIEFWVKITTAPTSGQLYGLVTKDDAGSARSYWVDYYNNGGTLQVRGGISSNGAGNLVEVSWNYTLTASTWFHVAVAITPANANATKAELFINGTSQGNGSAAQGGSGATSIFDSASPVVIGGYNAAGIYANAKFDDVRIWSTIRSQAQISANMSVQLVGNESNLVAYWKLNNALTDSTSNGNTLTNNNSATFTRDIGFAEDLTDGCVAYYKMEGNSNDSAGSHNGTDTSISYSSGDGKIGQGAGATNGLITNSSSDFNMNPASLSCWVKSSNFGASYRVLVKGGDIYSLFAKDNVLISYDWGAATDRSTGVNIADGNWHFIAVTFNSGVTNGSKIYIDGSLSLTFTCTASSYIALKMFSDGVGSQNASGSIDEVGVWGRILSATDITNLYNGGAGFQYPFTPSTISAKPIRRAPQAVMRASSF